MRKKGHCTNSLGSRFSSVFPVPGPKVSGSFSRRPRRLRRNRQGDSRASILPLENLQIVRVSAVVFVHAKEQPDALPDWIVWLKILNLKSEACSLNVVDDRTMC